MRRILNVFEIGQFIMTKDTTDFSMRAIQEIFLKIFCNSPELNCSIIFSMHMLSMTKKMNQFLQKFISESDFLGSTSVQLLFSIGTVLGEEPGRISTTLVSFLVSSSSCHGFLPLVVRPMMTIQEMFLKIVFDSPEFNRSIIFSM